MQEVWNALSNGRRSECKVDSVGVWEANREEQMAREC